MSLGLAILSCALATGTCHAAADPGVTSFAERVGAPAGSVVHLRAVDVTRGWIAAFCTSHVCSPFHVTLPDHSGTAAIQLSYVREDARAGALRRLHVAVTSAGERADAQRRVVL
jgi:hypothetical protein